MGIRTPEVVTPEARRDKEHETYVLRDAFTDVLRDVVDVSCLQGPGKIHGMHRMAAKRDMTRT